MNILLTINDISITGGAERVCINLANAFAESGNDVEIISFYRANHSLPYSTNAKLSFMHDFGENILRDKMLSNPIKKLYFKNLHKIILALKVWQKYKRTDIIITNDWTYMPIFKRKNTHYIKIHHSKFEGYNTRNNLFNTLVLLTIKEINIWQRYHSNIKIIPNFLPTIPQVATNHSQKVVLSVGRMSSEKGFLRLLDIWKVVRDRIVDCHDSALPNLAMTTPHPSLRVSETNEAIQTYCHTEGIARSISNKNDRDSSLHTSAPLRMTKCLDFANLTEWKLIIVGDGVLKGEIESKICALNLQDSVILKPFTKDIEREYLGASIYAMASHFEGFPMVLLESTAYGLAPISFDIATGPSDIIEHNESGFLIANNDLESYANHLITLMRDENLRAQFGAESRKIIQKRFSKEVVIGKWRDLLEKSR